MAPQPDDGSAVPTGGRSFAGRALVVIWVVVLLGLTAGAVSLAVLGPPPVKPGTARETSAVPAATPRHPGAEESPAAGGGAPIPEPGPQARPPVQSAPRPGQR